MHLECVGCGAEYGVDEVIYTCRRCGDLLDVRYDYGDISRKLTYADWERRPQGVWRYREVLPIRDSFNVVTLNEGATGLHPCPRLGSELGLKKLYVKNEGENPTGSFKDRGMTVGVTKALELNVNTVVCASTGNTSASLAAYAAKAGLRCLVLIPSGKVALGKLAQAMMYGAKVVAVRGNFDDALSMVRELAASSSLYLLNSINPFRLEGQKTASYEVWEQLAAEVPGTVILPVGNAGNISAYWKGFKELQALGFADKLPRMVGVQALGACPIVRAVEMKRLSVEPVKDVQTLASAIRIGNPVNWRKALNAVYESKGTAVVVADEEIVEAQKLLARLEGVFTEPAGAASIAALKKLREMGVIQPEETLVCVATGHGLKDPETALKVCAQPVEVDADLEALRKVAGVQI